MIGLGWGFWKAGWSVLYGEERKTIRRACINIRLRALEAIVAGGAVQTRNTASTSLSACIEALRNGQISAYDLDVSRNEASRVGLRTITRMRRSRGICATT